MAQKLSVHHRAKESSDFLSLIFVVISLGQPVRYIHNIDQRTGEYEKEILGDDVSRLEYWHVSYEKFSVSTGLSLPSEFWKNNEAVGAYAHFNKQVEDFKENIRRLYDSLVKAQVKFTKIEFKKYVQDHIVNNKSKVKVFHFTSDKKLSSIPTHLIKYVNYKIDIFRKTGQRATKTLEKYKYFNVWLEDFEKETKTEIDLLTINNDVVKQFIEWVYAQRKEDGSSYRLNYLHEMKKQLKLFVAEARDQDDIPVNPQVNLKKKILAKKTEKSDGVYLTMDQVNKIKKLKFDPEESQLERVRDMLIIGVNCGYRISDLKFLEHLQYNSKDGWYFHLSKSEKTKQYSDIPVMDQHVVKLYKKKYKEKFTFDIHENTFNRLVDQVIMRAGYTHKVQTTHIDPQTGKNIIEKRPFFDLVTSKTCRVTFASLAIREYKVPLEVVRAWMGHSDARITMGYVRLSQEDYFRLAQEQLKKLPRVYKI